MASENSDLKHFSDIPWCKPHLSQPGALCITPSNRAPKPNGEDELFARTLQTPKTITAFLAIFNPPPASDPFIREINYLITLESGLSGYASVCHGGVIAAILDEVTGLLFVINKEYVKDDGRVYMTGQLNTTFIKPVSVPGTFLCRVKVDKVEGRKYLVTGVIEDESGTALAKGEALFIQLKERL